MWGHKRKVRGHIKKFRPALRAGIVPPHLQIASDATGFSYTNITAAIDHFEYLSIAHILGRYDNGT